MRMLKHGEVPMAPLYSNWKEYIENYGEVAPIAVGLKIVPIKKDKQYKELPEVAAVKVHSKTSVVEGLMYFKGMHKKFIK